MDDRAFVVRFSILRELLAECPDLWERERESARRRFSLGLGDFLFAHLGADLVIRVTESYQDDPGFPDRIPYGELIPAGVRTFKIRAELFRANRSDAVTG